MDLATIELSPDEAADRLAAYRALPTDQRTPNDTAVIAGYRAALKGWQLIQLPDVIAAGGWFPDGLPRLACVRADARWCWVAIHRPWSQGPREVVYCAVADDRGRARVGQWRVRVDIPAPVQTNGRVRHAGRTLVPTIPPEHRPRRHLLGRFHILWEVEQWDDVAPRDPALLQHIRGDLWAVLATWDLTDLERAVLTGAAG